MNGNIAIKHAELDKSVAWDEIMKLVEKYGFIRFAYAGFAMLSIDEEVMKNNGL